MVVIFCMDQCKHVSGQSNRDMQVEKFVDETGCGTISRFYNGAKQLVGLDNYFLYALALDIPKPFPSRSTVGASVPRPFNCCPDASSMTVPSNSTE